MTTKMHPDMQILMKAREQATEQFGPPGEDPEGERGWWNVYASILSRPHPADIEVSERRIPTGDAQVPVRVYRPAGASGRQPAIIYLHGGGFVKGTLDDSHGVAWGYAQQTGATVVSVDYRLAPEHPYPAAFNDSYGVLTWLAENPDEFGTDPERIAVAGDSAGGNLAAAMCLAARDRGGPRIAAQVLVYPATSLDESAPSYQEFAEGTGLTLAAMQKYRMLYLPDDPDTPDPYARPAQAADFSGLPPALIHTAEMDPIRDDGRIYASKLALAGTWVTYREARGMIHGFLRARFDGPGAQAEFDVSCAFLAEHLGA